LPLTLHRLFVVKSRYRPNPSLAEPSLFTKVTATLYSIVDRAWTTSPPGPHAQFFFQTPAQKAKAAALFPYRFKICDLKGGEP
jgi:hypothetical protein